MNFFTVLENSYVRSFRNDISRETMPIFTDWLEDNGHSELAETVRKFNQLITQTFSKNITQRDLTIPIEHFQDMKDILKTVFSTNSDVNGESYLLLKDYLWKNIYQYIQNLINVLNLIRLQDMRRIDVMSLIDDLKESQSMISFYHAIHEAMLTAGESDDPVINALVPVFEELLKREV